LTDVAAAPTPHGCRQHRKNGERKMNRIVILSSWLTATALLCAPSLNASEIDAIPQRFHARVGGFNGFTYEVQLQDGRLEYKRSGGRQKSRYARVRPTTEQWTEFRRELDAIDIWRWRAQYLNPGVTDGTQWSLDLAFQDRAIKTQGSNDYPGTTPDSSGVPSASKAFARYLKAVQQLVGGRAFE
jgi:hypothetical protein